MSLASKEDGRISGLEEGIFGNYQMKYFIEFDLYVNIGQMGRVFTNGLVTQVSIPGRVIRKTEEMVLDTSLLNTQHYKLCIKGKVEQSRERSSTLPLHLSVVAIEKGAFRSSSTKVANFTLTI